MNRSIPIAKAMDDAMIALYQNGEALSPSNGYPMRLLLPGDQGNMNVKWLRRISLVDAPVMAINETKQYTILLPSGKAWQFYFPQEVKSFITIRLQASTGRPGFYEISGIAYSGNGRISKVEARADGGKSWAWRRCSASSEQSVHPFPDGVELGRPASDSAKPRDDEAGTCSRHARAHCRRGRLTVPRISLRLRWSTSTPSQAGASMTRVR